MAKKKRSIIGEGGNLGGGETTAGYFKKIFADNPQLLGERSNEPLLQRWLKDHPDHTEVPKSIKQNLSNVKSVLRSKGRKKAARKASRQAEHMQDWLQQPQPKPQKAPRGLAGLEALERHIDDCLHEARLLDKDGLEDVMNHLRRARNAVVWKIGQ